MARFMPLFLLCSAVVVGCDEKDENGNDTDTGAIDTDTDHVDTDTDNVDTDTDTTPAVEVVDCLGATVAQEVSIHDVMYDPAAFTISAGEIVQWTNNETATNHTVTSGNDGEPGAGETFDSEQIVPGDSYCLKFNDVGSYEYFCEVHPDVMNNGLVTVE